MRNFPDQSWLKLSLADLRSFAKTELYKLRTLNLDCSGPNKVFAYFSFWYLVRLNGQANVAKASLFLGENIPKQVFAKAKKVFKYVDCAYPYFHNEEKLVLTLSDFDGPNPLKDILVVYGHIVHREKCPDLSKPS